MSTKAEQNQNRDFYRHTFNSIFLKLKTPDQLQSAGEESLLTRDTT